MINLVSIKEFWKVIDVKRHTLGEHVHGKLSVAETLTHIAYCTAAFTEGHGVYSFCALALAFIILLSSVLHAD